MFHAINNIIPVLVLYGMQFLMQLMARALGMNGSGMWNFVMDTATSQVSQLSPAFRGIYMIDGRQWDWQFCIWAITCYILDGKVIQKNYFQKKNANNSSSG